MTLEALKQAVATKTAAFGVVGLGYVGLPVACLFAQAGFQTIGLDVLQERVDMINRGENPILGIEPHLAELIREVVSQEKLHATTTYTDLANADIIIVAVQTPIDESDHKPRYDHMRSALKALGSVLKDGALVIVESTLAPSTMRDVVVPVLEMSTGRRQGEGFYVGHCPERLMPGKLLHNIRHMDRVIGAPTQEIADIMVAFYQHVVQGTLDTTDLITAELVKTTENAYRDVQIAFANEVAKICEDVGGDVWRVRELVNKSPGRHMLLPGAGVGGHCIPKDPWLLLANSSIEASLIPAARSVNRSMPAHVLSTTKQALTAYGKDLNNAKIAVLGYAYLEDSDDTRDAPSIHYIELARAAGADVVVHDPFVHPYQTDIADTLRNADAAVILVAHTAYKQLNWSQAITLLRTPIIIDARRVLPSSFKPENATVRVIGIGEQR